MTHPLTDERSVHVHHPLTDELIDKIAHFDTDLTHEQFVNRNEDIRAAADWQLEQVLEWLQANLWLCDDELGPLYIKEDFLSDKVIDECKVIEDLKKAMRPQEKS